MKIDKQLLNVLCCPTCKSELYFEDGDSRFCCRKCNRYFPIRDGIPDMRADVEEKVITSFQLEGDEDPAFMGISCTLFTTALNLARSGGRGLDLGCGPGTPLYNLRKRFNGEIFALDILYDMLSLARKMTPDVKFVVGDALMTPFRRSAFDFILSAMVIEHVNDVILAKEIQRILRPGGILLLSTVLRKKGAIYFHRNARGKMVLEPSHLREYESVQEVKALLESNNFEVKGVAVDSLRFSPLDLAFRRLYRILPNEVMASLPKRNSIVAIRKFTRVPIPRYGVISIIARKEA